jgi:IclR family acetate operon transcriptional repressor
MITEVFVPRKATSQPGAAPSAPRYPIESVANAARILGMYRNESELRISDVAEALTISPSTAHRLLTTLEAADMVAQNPTTRCYVTGPALVAIAQALAATNSRWEFARPFMAELGERTGFTVNLQILQGPDVAFVQSVESLRPVRVGSRLGAVMPAYHTSGGKLLLARLVEDEILRLYPSPQLASRTPRSIGDRAELLAELRRVRRRGYATNFGESEPGVSAVAVLVSNVRGHGESALAVSAPENRLPQSHVRALVAELSKTADLLSASAPHR